MKKLYVSINEITSTDFWRRNTYKSFKRVDDHFECETFEKLWELLYHVSSNLDQYNSIEDNYVDTNLDSETAQAFYDGERSMMTEDIYKEFCDDFEVEYLEIDIDEEIESLQDDETKPFGFEAKVKQYLLSKDNDERELVALHYILEKGTTWKWAEQLEYDITVNEVETACEMG